VGPGAALQFALPVIAAGLIHVAVMRANLWPALARVPLDGGLRLRGRRLFGDNKTLRGLVVMPLASGAVAAALAAWAGKGSWLHALLFGAALGAGYVIGELPNSFVKRQLDVAPGAAAAGRWQVPFWFIDQVDSLLGVLLAARLFGPLPEGVVFWLLVVTLVVHPLFAGLMVLLGLKRRVG
jgi:hypothetical protein